MIFPRILIVDDEPSNLRVVERFLEHTRYRLAVAGSGAEALTRISEHGPFDLYIVDVMMPGMNGIELAEAIGAQQPEARFLYFTAFSDALFSGTRVLRDREAFLQKPVSKRELLEAVSLILFGDLRGPRE